MEQGNLSSMGTIKQVKPESVRVGDVVAVHAGVFRRVRSVEQRSSHVIISFGDDHYYGVPRKQTVSARRGR